MATYITSDCINCGACEPECPNDAISEGDDIYIIDPDLCTECVGFYDHEACQAVCPVECCLPDPNHPESEAILIERAIKLHPDDQELAKRAAANEYPRGSESKARSPGAARLGENFVARSFVWSLRICGAAAGMLGLGCGGGAPLLHGAHALNPGLASFGAGFSGTFTAGPARDAIQAAREPHARSSEKTIETKSGAVQAAMAPSVAPWVGARLGIKGDNEAGIAFTGRALRIDARHVFENGELAFSAGAGANFVWRNTDPVSQGSSLEFRVQRGYGFDVPLLVGWRSAAGVVSLWGGPRAGLETIGAEVTEPSDLPPFPRLVTDVDLLRHYIGGVAGLSMGFRHVHVALELDVLYQSVSGSLLYANVKVDGVTLSPAGALLFTF